MKPTRLFFLFVGGFVLQFPMLFIAIAIGMIGRSFDLFVGDAVGLFLSPGMAYFWGEGFHSNSPFGGLLAGAIANTLYFAAILFVCSIIWTKIRNRSRGHRTRACSGLG